MNVSWLDLVMFESKHRKAMWPIHHVCFHWDSEVCVTLILFSQTLKAESVGYVTDNMTLVQSGWSIKLLCKVDEENRYTYMSGWVPSLFAWKYHNVVNWLCMHAMSLQSCLTPCDPPGSSVHGILQARILEWVAMPFSRGSSRPRAGACVSLSPTLHSVSLLSELPGLPHYYVCPKLDIGSCG